MYNTFSNPMFSFNEGHKLTPKQLIKKHIFDPNHKVTDEELSQLDLGFRTTTSELIPEMKHKKTRPKD